MVKDWAFSFLQSYTPSVNLFLPLFQNNLWWLIFGNTTHTKESKWNTIPLGRLDCLIDRMAAVVKTLKLPVVSLRFPKSHPCRNFHFHQLGHCGEDNIGQEGETSWSFLLLSRFTTLVNSAPDNFDTVVQYTFTTIPNQISKCFTWAVASMLLTLVARCWVRNSCKLSHRVAR